MTPPKSLSVSGLGLRREPFSRGRKHIRHCRASEDLQEHSSSSSVSPLGASSHLAPLGLRSYPTPPSAVVGSPSQPALPRPCLPLMLPQARAEGSAHQVVVAFLRLSQR